MKKFLLPIVLIVVNLLVIGAMTMSGDGIFFGKTGLTHLSTALFSLANIFAIFRLRYLEGNVAFTIAKSFLVAVTLFGLGFITEYLISIAGAGDRMEVLADFFVLMLSAIGLVLILRGYNNVVALYNGNIKGFPVIMSGITAIFAIIVFEYLEYGASFELQSFLLPLVLVAFCVPVMVVLFLQSLKIGKKMSVLKSFMKYTRAGFVVLLVGIIFEFLEILGFAMIPELQVNYITHAMFNAGLSLQLLAFSTLFSLGGLYKELGK